MTMTIIVAMKERIRALLKLSGMSESRASTMIGQSRPYLNGLLKSPTANPGSAAVRRLAQLFGVSTDYLHFGGRQPLKADVQRAVANALAERGAA